MSPGPCAPHDTDQVNTLLDTLAGHVRRTVIYYFEQVAETKVEPVETVTSYVNENATSAGLDQTRVRLVHRDLPKLEQRGWLEFDATGGYVRYLGVESAERILTDLLEFFE